MVPESDQLTLVPALSLVLSGDAAGSTLSSPKTPPGMLLM